MFLLVAQLQESNLTYVLSLKFVFYYSYLPVAACLAELVKAFKLSSDLVYQQTVFGTCLKKPLPLRENLDFENYFMDDIVGTPLYKKFSDFVSSIRRSAREGEQSLCLGVVVQGEV